MPRSDSAKDSWTSKLFERRIEPAADSHNQKPSSKEIIYALQTHNFRADSRQKYIANVKSTLDLILAQPQLSETVELLGSWTVSVGDQDQALHLWKFRNGFKAIDSANELFSQNEDFQKLSEEEGRLVRSRHLQYLRASSYWPDVTPRKGEHIYEIRTFALKPGTMTEFDNNWSRAIKHQQTNSEAFAGLFSEIGRLYSVHHIWCYKNLKARRQTQEIVWRSPGWDECFAFTIPLIREMHCRILNPISFSPTQ